jgi:hypothetical protein
MKPVTSYRVVLPRPWVRIPVGAGLEERVHEIAERAMQRLPKEVPPDQARPMRREVERRVIASVRMSREYGGIDFYLPTDSWHGFLVGASFVVSNATPPGLLPEDSDDAVGAVGAVLAHLASSRTGTEVLDIGDTVWARTEQVVQPDESSAREGVDVATRRVDYLTAVPGDEARWILVAFSCVGDGNPDGELALLTTELFDAIMSTWRWIREGDNFAAAGAAN